MQVFERKVREDYWPRANYSAKPRPCGIYSPAARMTTRMPRFFHSRNRFQRHGVGIPMLDVSSFLILFRPGFSLKAPPDSVETFPFSSIFAIWCNKSKTSLRKNDFSCKAPAGASRVVHTQNFAGTEGTGRTRPCGREKTHTPNRVRPTLQYPNRSINFHISKDFCISLITYPSGKYRDSQY